MAWFKKARKPIAPPDKASRVPEGLWVKCPECDAIIYTRDLFKSLSVCTKCSHHFRLTARERLLMLFDGEYSHAVVKRPAAGDFRVQEYHGGVSLPCETPPAGAVDLAKAALRAAPAPASYARVDIIPDDEGLLRIMELELIEPALFLEHSPDRGAAFARSILRAAAHSLEQPLT